MQRNREKIFFFPALGKKCQKKCKTKKYVFPKTSFFVSTKKYVFSLEPETDPKSDTFPIKERATKILFVPCRIFDFVCARNFDTFWPISPYESREKVIFVPSQICVFDNFSPQVEASEVTRHVWDQVFIQRWGFNGVFKGVWFKWGLNGV